MDPSMSIAPPQPQPIEYLTNQMQNLSTNQPSLVSISFNFGKIIKLLDGTASWNYWTTIAFEGDL